MSSDRAPLQDAPPSSTDADKKKSSAKWRKPLLVAGVLTFIVVLVLTALPYVVAHYATRWLVDHGASTARIDDVNINVFTGVVGVFGLDASDGQEAQLQIESAEVGLRWWPLAQQRVHIEFLQLTDGVIDVVASEQGTLQIGAVKIDLSTEDAPDQTIEVSAADSPAWGFGSELVVVEDLQLSYRDELFATTVEARELRIGSHFSWEAGRTTNLVVDVSVDGAPLVLNSDVSPWGEQREFSGALRLEDFDLSKHRQALSELAGLSDPRGALQFDFQLDLLHAADGALELKISGPLQLQDVAFGLGDMSFANKNVAWQGAVSLALPARQDKNMLLLDGRLTLADTQVGGIGKTFEARLAGIDWRGSLEFSPPATPDGSAILKSSGSLNGAELTVNHAQLPFQLVGLEEFAVDELQVDDLSEVSAGRFSLQELKLLEDRTKEDQLDTIFSLERFDIGAFVYGATDGVSVETMTLLQPKAVVSRKPSGQLHRIQEVLDVLLAEQEPDNKAADEEQINKEQIEK